MKDMQNTDIEKIIGWMIEKKADDVKFFDVRDKTDYTDYIILATGANELHIKAIAQNVLDKAKEEQILLLGKEGMSNANWILLDMGGIVVHITLPESRELYKFDTLFESIQKKRIELEGETNLDLDTELDLALDNETLEQKTETNLELETETAND